MLKAEASGDKRVPSLFKYSFILSQGTKGQDRRPLRSCSGSGSGSGSGSFTLPTNTVVRKPQKRQRQDRGSLSSTILESQESESSQIVSHTKIHICSSTTIKRFCTSSSPSKIFLTSYQTNAHGSQLATNGSHVNRWRAGWPLMLHSLTYSHTHTDLIFKAACSTHSLAPARPSCC